MPFVEVNPVYEPTLTRLGLHKPEHYLNLPGPIISGHPDRHVARVTLGEGQQNLRAFLKREHRVPWRARLANALEGFGLVSRSTREALTLHCVAGKGVGCPEWIAHGEDDRGRAFLLVGELVGAIELRQFLRQRRQAAESARLNFAHRLGKAIARIHRAGIAQPDLYAKHVLVRPVDEALFFLDWQRSRLGRRLTWRTRARGLAALDATLNEQTATAAERWACLQGYLEEAGTNDPSSYFLTASEAAQHRREFARAVRRHRQALLRKRHVLKERLGEHLLGGRAVYWLDGEALCVTSDFWELLRGDGTNWLTQFRDEVWRETQSLQKQVELPGPGRGALTIGCHDRPWQWLWAVLRGKDLVAPEVRKAGELFGLSDQPRLLAFGQRRPLPWRTEAFLLTEIAARAKGRPT